MIPKIIHYCWFGNAEKPELIKKCIASWKKNCPDYEIIEWNEDNFNIEICDYVREAYSEKKWAFISDYARHYVLNKYGGIYLDTDVELLKPLDTFLVTNFVALENADSIATGLIMGCEGNNWFCQRMLNEYNNDHFISTGIRKEPLTVCERTTKIFTDEGFVHTNKIQKVSGFTIFPTEYFCPVNPITYEEKITNNTVSIHHYGGSWCPPEQKEYLELRAIYARKYPRALASTIAFYKIEKKYKGIVAGLINTIKQIFIFCFGK